MHSRILVITEVFERGGLETHILSQARALARRGIQLYLATGSSKAFIPIEVFADVLTDLHFGLDATVADLRASLEAIVDFSRELETSIVHAHPFHGLGIGYLTAAKLNQPLLATLHGPASLSSIPGGSSKTIFNFGVLPHASEVFSVSRETQLLCRIAGRKSVLLPNAVRKTGRKGRGGPDWVWAGRLDSEKSVGLLDLIEKMVGMGRRLVVCGDGSYRSTLEERIGRDTRYSFVEFVGWDTALGVRFAKSDVVAGMGRVIIEAGGAGRPMLLVGYDGVKGMVSQDTVDDMAYSNFSGRGLETISAAELLKQVGEFREHPTQYDISGWVFAERNELTIWDSYAELLPAARPFDSAFAGTCLEFFEHAADPRSKAWLDPEIATAIAGLAIAGPASDEGRAASPSSLQALQTAARMAIDDMQARFDEERARLLDDISRARQMEQETANERAALQHQSDQQNQLIESLRDEMRRHVLEGTEALRELASECDRLRSENDAVRQEVAQQRAAFLEQEKGLTSTLAAAEADRDAKQQIIEALQFELAAANEEQRSALERELQSWETKKAILEAELEEKSTKQALASRDLEVALDELRALLAEKASIEAFAAEKVAQRDSEIATLTRLLDAELKNARSLDDTVVALKNNLVAKKRELVEADYYRNHWQYLVESTRSSTSWRLTAPLRIASGAVRGLLDWKSHRRRIQFVAHKVRTEGVVSAAAWVGNRTTSGRTGQPTFQPPLPYPSDIEPNPAYELQASAEALPAADSISEPPVESAAFSLIRAPFNPYKNIELIKPILVDVIEQKFDGVVEPFTCVTTVRNEAESIVEFLDSISSQSSLPEELILVDGGSTDETVDFVRRWASTANISMRIVEPGNVSIAKGRNIGVGLVTTDVVIFLDAGTALDPDFLREMAGAFATRPDLDVACGLYRSKSDGPYAREFIWDWSSPAFDWSAFLPSARALAVRAATFRKTSGFPEYLTRTGEDTLFAVDIRRCSNRWAVVKHAQVVWDAPKTAQERDKLTYNYAYGDGESGYGDFLAYPEAISKDAKALVSHSFRSEIWFNGFRAGRAARARIEYENRNIRSVVIILSGVPLTDSGGGQRCSQLALAFSRAGHKVIFVNIYPSFEEEKKLYFDADLSTMELYALRDFDADDIVSRYGSFQDILFTVISEFPHPWLIPVIDAFKSKLGGRVSTIYDYIDNWNTTLGWEWYSPEVEQRFITESDYLVASAQTLKAQLKDRSGRDVLLVPNAVNDGLFNRHLTYDRPPDLPSAGKIVTYIGAMWGSWFDWDLLLECASRMGDVTFAMIGGVDKDRQADIEKRFKNVHFLGLKPQRALPAYLAYSDAAIIPFMPDDVTPFVNPLKVYEYVAMGVNVVASNMPEVEGIPGVAVTRANDEFLAALGRAISSPPPVADMDAFTQQNNWDRRLERLSNIGGT